MATMGESDAYALVDKIAKNLSEIKAETLEYTLGKVDTEALFVTLAHTLAGVEVEKPLDTLCDVQASTLVDGLAYMLAWKKKKTHAATTREKWRLRH